MEKIGRNDPCPCGSGKKFKHCHLTDSSAKAVGVAEAKKEKLTFKTLVKTFNNTPILNLLGALQLCPDNHGKTLRLEQMARHCLLAMRDQKQTKRLNAHWGLLQEAIENYTDEISLEERPIAAFSENVVFSEGNYIVYPGGVSVSSVRILNELLECIFLIRNELPDEYIRQVKDGAGLLLYLSNLIAKKAEHGRYVFAESKFENITLPKHEQAIENSLALGFKKELIGKICELYGYDIAILDNFLISPDIPELDNDDPDNNVVNKKPLLEDDDEIVVFMPTSLVSAVTNFICTKAVEFDCTEELSTLLLQRQFDKTESALRHMGWSSTNIELPGNDLNLSIQEAVFQFDNQKLSYLCFIGRSTKKVGYSLPSKDKYANPFKTRMEQVTKHLESLSTEQPYQVLSLFILAETGDDSLLFAWPKGTEGHLSLSFTYNELNAVSYDEGSELLTLWKFAKIFDRTTGSFRIESFGGILDAYIAYKKNDGSFFDSDDTNPIGGSLFIPVGLGNEFLRDVQAKRDEHAVSIFYNQQRGYTKVIRYKQYAPIYREKEPLIHEEGKVSRLVIETYKMPIWITNYSNPSDNSLTSVISEGIAFWLHKMKDFLYDILYPLTLIQFEIEIINSEDQESEIIYAEDEPDISNIDIKVTIEAPRIQLHIPARFLVLVRRTDNYADKMLMTAVLNGISDYVKEAKDNILLTSDSISEIIESVLQIANAKMFLFSDSSWNIRLDERNLPPMRYINEADVSYVLDNLVNHLPKDYQVPEKVIGKENKLDLCRKIVEGLINQIKEKIKPFDGPKLLEWLIKMNEKCVQVREFREITIPPKIACFSSFDSEVKELLNKGTNQVRVGQALRVLIEFVAANLPLGSRWPNFDEIEELLALVDQVISWGGDSDAIWTELDDPEMGLLPSGRIGTEKTLQRKTLAPYMFAKTTSELFQIQENWKKNYDPKGSSKKPEQREYPKEILDAAFKSEFQIPLSKLGEVVWTLIGHAFKTATTCIIIEEKELQQLLLANVDEISKTEVTVCINLLTLFKRKDISAPQKGFDRAEIYPWRHKRDLSYLRKPLASSQKDDATYYYYGYRQLLAYWDNLHYLLHTGKLPNAKSKELIAWLGSAGCGKGNPFRESVKEWFQNETSFQVIEHEVDISEDGHLKAERPYGDIDLLVFDHDKKIAYSIECKNITGGKTIYEMWSEISGYLGKDKTDNKAKIVKHANRDKWLQENKESLSYFIKDPVSYQVKSFVLCADEIPLTYLKRHQLPLPVKSFVFLRIKGISLLDCLK